MADSPALLISPSPVGAEGRFQRHKRKGRPGKQSGPDGTFDRAKVPKARWGVSKRHLGLRAACGGWPRNAPAGAARPLTTPLGDPESPRRRASPAWWCCRSCLRDGETSVSCALSKHKLFIKIPSSPACRGISRRACLEISECAPQMPPVPLDRGRPGVLGWPRERRFSPGNPGK